MRKLAIVTGATGGIGQVIVEALVAASYHVIACMHTQLLPLAWAEMYGATVLPCRIDLATMDRAALETALGPHLEAYRYQVALLVTAHGAAPVLTPTLELDTETMARVYETDVLGTMRIAQTVAPSMLSSQAGSMIFISSLHARQTYPARANYAAAKAGVCGLARSLALEWGVHGVRVNTILPWQTAGPRTTRLAALAEASGEDLLGAYCAKAPLRRLVEPGDIARTVLFLAETPSITGQEIVLDCGVSASMWYRSF